MIGYFLMMIAGCLSGYSQGLYNDGSLISVSAQTIFKLPDSLVNNGTLINNGELIISGAWINKGTYTAGEGEINFDNNLTQVINHNDQSIGKLVISGGGKKHFLANITIQSELRLENGILESGNGAKIIMNQGVTVIGASDNSHILGAVEHSGLGDWLFPTGNGTVYLPVNVTNVTDPVASATLSLNELTSGQALSGDPDLAALSTKRYWQLALTGNLNTSKINLPLSGEDELTSNNEMLVVAGSNTGSGPYSSLGKSEFTGTLSSGSLTSDQAPAFSFFTVASLTGETGIEVFNAVSPNGDTQNDYMRIRNIELYPGNHVLIYNRWGDKVFEMSGYDNDEKSFKGESNVTGKKLPGGTYFYSIDLKDGSGRKTGFVALK